MAITTETITVFKTARGRRFLTKRAAFRSEVLGRLKGKDRHEMQGVYDELRGGEHYQEEFYTQEQWEHFQKIERRYWRRFRRSVA